MTSLYVAVQPAHLDLAMGDAGSVTVSITNPSTAIDGYRIRVFGLDPEWVTISPARVAVFPGETADVVISFALPAVFTAGQRQFTVQVNSENDPDDFSLVQLPIMVGSQPRARLKMDPVSVVGGKRATFNLVVFNDGNTPIHAVPEGVDPEETATFQFEPAAVDVRPAQRETIEVRVEGKRPWVGAPKARVLTIAISTPDRLETVVSFVQRPRISRWLLSMAGLAAAAAVFAVVLGHTFQTVVDENQIDQGVLNKALDKEEAGGVKVPLHPLAITGAVQSLAESKPIAGVQADLYLQGDTTVPIYTAATDDAGSYTFGRLAAGKPYVLKFSGAGFGEVWYPGVSAAEKAEPISLDDLEPGASLELKPVVIGGRPGSISGRVIIEDAKGVTATLFRKGVIDETTPAVLKKVNVGADGGFAFANVPTPQQYTLRVEKPGFAPDERVIVLDPAQAVTGLEVTLRRGDGIIAGQISSPAGPLGGVEVVATDGTTKIVTSSLTIGTKGAFVLRGLPTPGVYTVTVTLALYTSESRTIVLGQGEERTDVSFGLARTTGSIQGAVSLTGAGALGGVTVTVTGGDVEVSTTTISQGDGIGTFRVEGLAVPATYTVSFSRTGLVPQVRLQDLDPLKSRSCVATDPAGSQCLASDAVGVDATMVTATATLHGFVKGTEGTDVFGVSQAQVVLSDGTTERTLFTSDTPTTGEFEFVGVPPGTYTVTAKRSGSEPSVQLVTLGAGCIGTESACNLEFVLLPKAKVNGVILKCDAALLNCVPFDGVTVRLFKLEDFPTDDLDRALTTAYLTGPTGAFEFTQLDAPKDLVVVVYENETTTTALESLLVFTIPSGTTTIEVKVPT